MRGLSGWFIQPLTFHDAARHRDAFIANVHFRASNQFPDIGRALAAKRTRQSSSSKHISCSLLKHCQKTTASVDDAELLSEPLLGRDKRRAAWVTHHGILLPLLNQRGGV